MVPLTLAEQLLLLTIDDDTGKLLPIPDRTLDYALAGAMIADLVRVKRIQIVREQVIVIDAAPVNSAPEDFALRNLDEGEGVSLRTALTHLAGEAHGLRKRLIKHLVEKHVLREEGHDFLWIFHYTLYPLADRESEIAVKQRLRNRILMPEGLMTERDHVMISLIHICHLEDMLLSREEQNSHRELIDDICLHDRIGKAILDCLEEIQKAILEIRTYAGM